jgi:hypothetical protein
MIAKSKATSLLIVTSMAHPLHGPSIKRWRAGGPHKWLTPKLSSGETHDMA